MWGGGGSTLRERGTPRPQASIPGDGGALWGLSIVPGPPVGLVGLDVLEDGGEGGDLSHGDEVEPAAVGGQPVQALAVGAGVQGPAPLEQVAEGRGGDLAGVQVHLQGHEEGVHHLVLHVQASLHIPVVRGKGAWASGEGQMVRPG